jgi:hypothetical protein
MLLVKASMIGLLSHRTEPFCLCDESGWQSMCVGATERDITTPVSYPSSTSPVMPACVSLPARGHRSKPTPVMLESSMPDLATNIFL